VNSGAGRDRLTNVDTPTDRNGYEKCATVVEPGKKFSVVVTGTNE
jgi:hypothetical protein